MKIQHSENYEKLHRFHIALTFTTYTPNLILIFLGGSNYPINITLNICILQAFRDTLLFIVLGEWTPGAHAENEHVFSVVLLLSTTSLFSRKQCQNSFRTAKKPHFFSSKEKVKFVVHKRDRYSCCPEQEYNAFRKQTHSPIESQRTAQWVGHPTQPATTLLKKSKGEENGFCSRDADPISDIQLALMVVVLSRCCQLNVVKESNGQHNINLNYYHIHAFIKMVRCDDP